MTTTTKPRFDFNEAVIFATLLHVIILAIFAIRFEPKKIEVPFKILNVKIGKVDLPATKTAHSNKPEPRVKPSPTPAIVKNTINPVEFNRPEDITPDTPPTPEDITDEEKPEESGGKVTILMPMEILQQKTVKRPAAPSPAPVRKAEKSPKARGSILGNTQKTGLDKVENYEQVLSLWLGVNKVYPESARRQAIEGEGVVRLQIQRNGNVIYYALLKRTGHQILDDAIMEMVRKSDPVPPIPDGYADGKIIQFDVPIKFKLD